MMDLYEWKAWPEFLRVDLREMPLTPGTPVVSNHIVSIEAWPVAHMIPTIGLRMTNQQTGKVLVYTSDTMRPVTPIFSSTRRPANTMVTQLELMLPTMLWKPMPNGWC
jgi:ribonuclease BN (tRNA processing enzyme)